MCYLCQLQVAFLQPASWLTWQIYSKSNVTNKYRGHKRGFADFNKGFSLQRNCSQNPFSKQYIQYVCEKGWFEFIWKTFYQNRFVWSFFTEPQRPESRCKQDQIHLISEFKGLCHTAWTNLSVERENAGMYCIYGWLQHCIAVVFATTKHPDSTWKLLVSEHIVRKELGLLYACCLWGHFWFALQDGFPVWRTKPVSRDKLCPKLRLTRDSFRRNLLIWRRYIRKSNWNSVSPC